VDHPAEDQVSLNNDLNLYNWQQKQQTLYNTYNKTSISRTMTVPFTSSAVPAPATAPTTAPATAHATAHATAPAPVPAPRCNFIKPVPSQILTVFTQDKRPVHIELDSNATVNYIRIDAAKSFNFHITPNTQLSILADGVTKLPAVGEIKQTFCRNDWTVTFHAVVVQNLHTQLIGGTVFLKDNNIQQDFIRNTIQVGGKFTVPSTSAAILMPIQPYSHLCSITSNKTLLPGQSIKLNLPFTDNNVIAVESASNNNNNNWPPPQLCTIKQGAINITNNGTTPIILGKDVKQVQIHPTSPIQPKTQECGKYTTPTPTTPDLPTIPPRSDLPTTALNLIRSAHAQYAEVFDKNLSHGYNGAHGPHTCRLNWAGDTRPTADQVRMVSYSHDLKQLHQAVCDDLTNQQVLGIPQNHGINVQFVCPSFLRRKPRAKGKPNHLLTKDDVRLVVNFSPVNDHLKNIPSVKTTPNDILIALGRWKCIIIFDLYQGFFQNHMDNQDCKWLGIATPFGGIRFLRRSGQGLLGQSEEMEELLTKILKTELESGSCCKIADDIIIGGQTFEQAATTYQQVLAKLAAANIKLAASKTHIFPKSADILGWKWHEGSRLQPSPHRQLALKNTKQDDITTIKDLRSWIGLYKTLLIATPNLATIMDPFDQETASKDSKDKVAWTSDLAAAFRYAKNHIDNIKELYLPSPNDQLLLVPDGSQKTPGIGHILYALVEGHRKPVRYHSVKLPDNCKKWSPCEVEALAFATGIQSEIDLIKESKHPLLIAPDSSPVKDAVNLIKKGKFSASARMNSFITNINRIPVEVLHVSGKANLNAVGDMQSRNPSTCTAEHCTICTFIHTAINSVLRPNASLGAISSRSLYNTKSWAAAQESNAACSMAASHLKTGKQPSKKSGKLLTEVRRYCAIAKIGPDGCLIVPPTTTPGTHQLQKIIIPTPLLPSLLWHMHNNENHPTKTQLRAMFDKMFYGIMVQQQIDLVYQECFQCKVQAQLPKIDKQHNSCVDVTHPGQYFHADVIRREKQKIFIIRDQFSSLTAATLIQTEQHNDLKSALITLTTPIRLAPDITVRTDAATGFQAITKDAELKDIGINIDLSDTLNKNSNAVADRACSEIETEINKLQPQGGTITQTTLNKAVLLLNTKIRRKDHLSATEIHFSRDQATSSNLHLDDIQLRTSQLEKRQLTPPQPKPPNNIKQGDTVILAAKPQKHITRDVFLVTQTNNQKVYMQKIAHPFSANTSIRPKTYTTGHNLLHPIYQPKQQANSKLTDEPQLPQPKLTRETQWSPFRKDYYLQPEIQEDDEENPPPEEPEQHINPPQRDNIPPPLQQMANWLQQQQQQARHQHLHNENALQAFILPPVPTPPVLPLPPVPPPLPVPQPPMTKPQPAPRQAKLKAIKALSSAAQQQQPNIPQLEGAEITPETTPEATPNTSYTEAENHHLSPLEPWSPLPPHGDQHPLNLAFLLEDCADRSPSPEWDHLMQEPYFMMSDPDDSYYQDHQDLDDDLLFSSPHPGEQPHLHHLLPPQRRQTY